MCWYGGIMTLEEYRKEVSDIYNIYQAIFEKSQDDEVYEVILQFRDDKDLVSWGICNKVYKHFDSVRKYILKESELIDFDFEDEPIANRAYWSVKKYKTIDGEFEEIMNSYYSTEMEFLKILCRGKFMDNMIDHQKQLNYDFLLNSPNNVSTPYQTGDILRINAMPFGEDLYVVYGGEQEKDNPQKHDGIYHWCIYESEDRNGLWIDDISNAMFTDYIYFRNSPLINCERVDSCPNDKIAKVSKILKDKPNLWFDVISYWNTICDGNSNLEPWIL